MSDDPPYRPGFGFAAAPEGRNTVNMQDDTDSIDQRPEILFVHGSHRQHKIHAIINTEQYRVVNVDLIIKTEKLKFIKYVKIIKRILVATIYANVRKGRPLYILSDGTSHMLLFAYMIAAGARRPLLIRIRGDNWDAMGSEASELRTFKQNLRAALQRHIDNFVFPKAALILSVSGHLQSIVQRKFHLSTEKLAVVNVPLTNNGQPVPCLPAPSDTSGQTILVVTNFEYWQKCGAIFDFMDDIVAFFEKYGEAKIAIVGDGTHLARMKREFSKFPISDHVVFLGKIHDMSTVYSTANAFLHLTYLDAFPNVIVEAQAMGLPTVINNFGGSVEALTAPGGVVVNQNARGELFNALDDIFANPADAASRAAISRAETLRRFSPPAIAASFRQTVDERLAPTR